MTQKLVALATRVKITPAQQAVYTAAKEAGEELFKVFYIILNSGQIMARSFTNNNEYMQGTMYLSIANYSALGFKADIVTLEFKCFQRMLYCHSG